MNRAAGARLPHARAHVLGLYRNFPASAALGSLFSERAGCAGYFAAPHENNLLYCDYRSAPVSLVRSLPHAPDRILGAQVVLVPNASFVPAAGECVALRFRDGAGAVLCEARVTFGDLAGSTGTATVKLTPNRDATGVSAGGRVKDAGVFIGLTLELHADPMTGRCNCCLGHEDGADHGDGVLAADLENIGPDVLFDGAIRDVQLYAPAQSAGVVKVASLAVMEDPWVLLGDSVGGRLRDGAYFQNETRNGCFLGVPLLLKGRSGRCLTGASPTALANNTHWRKLSYLQGYRRVVVGPIGTNDFGQTGAGQEAAVKAAFETILADLAAQPGREVAVCTLPPRGPALARDTATAAAVASVNAHLRALARGYRFRVLELHARLADGMGDSYAPGYSTDGVHPACFAGAAAAARALRAALQEPDGLRRAGRVRRGGER